MSRVVIGVDPHKASNTLVVIDAQERVLASIPYFHIFGMTVAMVSLLKQGHELLILPDPRNMKEALKTIAEKKPTLFPAVPRLLQAISENPKVGNYDLSSLQAVISGGAALPHADDALRVAHLIREQHVGAMLHEPGAEIARIAPRRA